MIPAVLRIILDHENACLWPEAALADGLDNAAQRQVVVCHLRLGGWKICLGSTGVVVWQTDDAKVRKTSPTFKFLQFRYKLGGPENIGNCQFPAYGVRRQI